MKKYRFFYHYFKAKKKMSIHFRNKCHIVNNVKCDTPCETKWNKRQPNLIMIGWAQNVVVTTDGIGIIT